MVKKSKSRLPANWKDNLLVRPMNDGKMGSLLLFPYDITKNDRMFGKQISECQFKDKDGIDVIASLYIDDKGNLFELDIWKVDFSPLLDIPQKFK
ncbi:hypothetical protein Aasi_0841 [Candidatus Amoebophilus asiaticus 5a2]|uniref:DUF6984 domain-containing protein n=1 Tax=Amoebophilus asiaticus (strain 5a2) TaxID=452471 RepID=B3ESL0_AMOA5|nr:hypothetical protein [Candidatus Amoebophilus asiaticus]ACE06212.1 hypothetical protein Aasi_0841 [Candidatus Amoebophilus asiaticus 5a2]